MSGLLRRAKYRLDERSVNFNLRRHHDDIAGRQGRISLEPVEHVIVQNLHFPKRAVTGVDLNRVIIRLHGRPRAIEVLAAISQMQNVCLDAMEQRVVAGMGKIFVRDPVARVEDQFEEVASKITEGGEQTVAKIEMSLEWHVGAGGATSEDALAVAG